MIQLGKKGLITVFIGLFILAGMSSCEDDFESSVPYVPVNYSFNPANVIELNIPGGAFYLPNLGYGGILVFRNVADNPNPFLAYDAACTYEIAQGDRQVVISDNGLAKCPKCGSEYILFEGSGSPVKGPAIEPLKQYRTSYTGGLISIRN